MLLATIVQLIALSASPLTVAYLAPDDVHSELIRRYLNAVEFQNAARRDVDVEVTIDARVPRVNRQATLRTLRRTSATGTITYTTLDARGDSMVRREVIARYLTAESEGRNMADIAITPFNYRFRFKSLIEEPTRQVYVFQLKPTKKKVGLFKGELWVDGQTGLPVHESGQFIKSPSVFVKRISFTRDYATRGGSGVPVHIHSTVESRIAGRVELDIRFTDADSCGNVQVEQDVK
jgi:hypothetical protein